MRPAGAGMLKKAGVSSIVLAIAAASISAESWNEAQAKSISVAGSLRSGDSFQVDLRVHPTSEETPQDDRYWGPDGSIPKRLIDDIKLRIGAALIDIPKTAFCDLADIQVMSLRVLESESTVSVWVRGGDGAGGYRARLEVVDGAIARRSITHFNPDGEFVEETVKFASWCGDEPRHRGK